MSVGGDALIRIWRIRDGYLVTTLDVDPNPAADSLAFSLDGRLLVSGGPATIRLWRVANGTLIRTWLRGVYQPSAVHGLERIGTTAEAFSPDGQVLAASSNRDIQLWQISSGQLLQTLLRPGASVALATDYSWEEAVQALAFSPAGNLLASGTGATYVTGDSDMETGADHVVRLWEMAGGHLQQTWTDPRYAVGSVAFSPDGQLLAAAGGGHDPAPELPATDTVIRLWRIADGHLLNTFAGHTNFVASVAFSPHGTTLASGSEDGTVRFWRVK